jgi:hypothetical protein
VTPLAGGFFTLPAGIQWSDIWYISERLLVIALIIALIGIFVLKRLAARSIALMVVVVVAVSVLTSMSGPAAPFPRPCRTSATAACTSPRR